MLYRYMQKLNSLHNQEFFCNSLWNSLIKFVKIFCAPGFQKLLNESFHTKKMKCFLVFFFCFIIAFSSDSVLILLEFISGCGVRYRSHSVFSKRVINFSNRVNYIPLISVSYHLSGIIKYSWYKELRQVGISYKQVTSLDSSGTMIKNHHPPHCWNLNNNLLAHSPNFDDFALMKNNNALTTELASVLLN